MNVHSKKLQNFIDNSNKAMLHLLNLFLEPKWVIQSW